MAKTHKATRKLQFTKKTQEKIYYRDNGECIFCAMGYYTDCRSGMLLQIKDIMHYIPKSSMGMGIEQNGALGCRYHHDLLDNGNRGRREDMLQRFEAYLKSIYPDWKKEDLIYRKYNF